MERHHKFCHSRKNLKCRFLWLKLWPVSAGTVHLVSGILWGKCHSQLRLTGADIKLKQCLQRAQPNKKVKVNQVLLHNSISQGRQMQQWGALLFLILCTVPIQHPLTSSFLLPEGSSLMMLFRWQLNTACVKSSNVTAESFMRMALSVSQTVGEVCW